MSKAKTNLIRSTLILGAAGILVKILGAVFRIALTNFIHFEGMSYYQQAFPVYSALLIISTIGLPIAVSKLVSERVTADDWRGAYAVFRTARTLLVGIGVAAAIIMFSLSKLIAAAQGLPDAMYSLMAISPALFFVAGLSAYRGYFQGLQNMKPTAVSQIVEQVTKVCVGLALCLTFLKVTGEVKYGAMGALLGVTAAECAGMLFVIRAFGKEKRAMTHARMAAYHSHITWQEAKPIAGRILIIALPVTAAGLVMPVVTLIDSFIIPRSLFALGYATAEVRSMYGALTGGVLTLINLTAIISQALQMSVVPAISEALELGDEDRARKNVVHGLKFAFLEGVPAFTAFFIFAGPMLSFLYPTSSAAELTLSRGLLMAISMVALFLPLMQTMTGILQGVGKQNLPPISLLAGACVKVGLSLYLMTIPEINIYGAVIGTCACYVVAAAMNYHFVRKHTGVKLKLFEHIGKPVIASAVMAAAAAGVYALIGPLSNAAGMIACAAAGMFVYFVMLGVLKAVTEEEMLQIRGGKKIAAFFRKVRIWK